MVQAIVLSVLAIGAVLVGFGILVGIIRFFLGPTE